MIRFMVWIVLWTLTAVQPLAAQSSDDVVWVQIEAQPNLEDALTRVQDYAARLDDVNGFSLGRGWFAIALGPYTAEDADRVLRSLRAQGLIPRDSYIAFSRAYGEQFYPQAAGLLQANPQPAPLAPSGGADAAALSPPEIGVDTETPAQARLSERLLDAQARRDLQIALKDAGFYNAAVDGAFGQGTRNSMAAWQRANGLEATGILTTLQRAALMRQFNAILEDLDLATVRDTEAGIEMKLPTGVVSFARYEAPFAEYDASGTLPARVLLISQPGNSDTLAGLYDILQTLEIVPLEGPRSLSGDGFTLVGRNDTIVSETRVTLADGQIKGFTLIWPAGDEARRARLLSEMAASFVSLDGVLARNADIPVSNQIDLVAGLRVRQPLSSQSGFYVDARGSVVTTAEGVESCGRILLDDTVEARLSKLDAGRGLAVLQPQTRIAPPDVAEFRTDLPRLQSEVAVAGYSYGGVLNAPSMTFGTLEDLRGLGGEPDLKRLTLESLPGDAGGPVFDDTGQVIGMLLPRGQGDRQLPSDVSFALAGGVITQILQNAGLTTRGSTQTTALDPEDITARGQGMTVLVTCWE